MSIRFPYKTRIAGVTFHNEDGTSRQDLVELLDVGDELSLVDSSSIDHPDAIGVFNADDEQLGFLPAAVASQFRSENVNYECLTCLVSFIGRPDDDKPLGVSIVIAESDDQAMSVIDMSDKHTIRMRIPIESVLEEAAPSISASPKSTASTVSAQYHPFSDATVSEYRKPKKKDSKWGRMLLFFLICVIIGLYLGYTSTH